MRPRSRILLLASVLSAVVAPTAAAADKLSPTQKFAAAQDMADNGKCEEALPIFRETLKTTQSPNARLYVARCLLALGHLPEAYDEMSATLRDASARADTEPRYAPTRDSAAAELVQIERRVGRLIIAVANPPPGVAVFLDGNEVPQNRVGYPIAVMPGRSSVTVTAPDREPMTRKLAVGAGEIKTVAVALKSVDERGEPSPSSISETTSEPEADTGRRGGGVRIAGYAVAGLGVAGMALFGVTGMMAQSKFKSLEEECGGVRCTDAKYADTVDSGKTLDLLANIGLIAGASALTIGGAMILFGGPSSEVEATAKSQQRPRKALPTTTATAGFSLTPQSASVRCAFTF
ncbi:tetratricopeptide repeat protein [Chondromyces crocatus]|uniref:PEGA domain-containing protein n=1 Tax=Chondromyces crocatus TaxID=52 RepID=A0A0K1EP15_CHOCO|nr:tetratricopeptide repeat protein [Chondromyces crocatus]AKT42655.1 uncharacterized protein CMC5_068820 [Chondromyces crocatus]